MHKHTHTHTQRSTEQKPYLGEVKKRIFSLLRYNQLQNQLLCTRHAFCLFNTHDQKKKKKKKVANMKTNKKPNTLSRANKAKKKKKKKKKTSLQQKPNNPNPPKCPKMTQNNKQIDTAPTNWLLLFFPLPLKKKKKTEGLLQT
jgi:hypothetical protein